MHQDAFLKYDYCTTWKQINLQEWNTFSFLMKAQKYATNVKTIFPKKHHLKYFKFKRKLLEMIISIIKVRKKIRDGIKLNVIFSNFPWRALNIRWVMKASKVAGAPLASTFMLKCSVSNGNCIKSFLLYIWHKQLALKW